VAKTVSSGYKVVYPNRDKAASKLTKLVVCLILLISAALLLILTVGGWSKLAGLKVVNLFWCVLYVGMAFYIFVRWARGLLPMAAGLGILLMILAIVAGVGLTGTSWFDRDHHGFAAAQSLFGGSGLNADVLGLITVLLIPVQALLIFFSMLGFTQAWNVETEVPEDESKRQDKRSSSSSSSPEPATA
jgi:signal transduction histidine kinase